MHNGKQIKSTKPLEYLVREHLSFNCKHFQSKYSENHYNTPHYNVAFNTADYVMVPIISILPYVRVASLEHGFNYIMVCFYKPYRNCYNEVDLYSDPA